MLRQKSFGGKSGVWYGGIKRKRIRNGATNQSHNTNAAQVVPSVPINQTLQHDKNDHVQWDETLCRPIYQRGSSFTEKSSEVDSPWKPFHSNDLTSTFDTNQTKDQSCFPIIIPTPLKDTDPIYHNVITFDQQSEIKKYSKKASFPRATYGSKSSGVTTLDVIDEETFYEYHLTETKRSLAFAIKENLLPPVDEKRNDDDVIASSKNISSTKSGTSRQANNSYQRKEKPVCIIDFKKPKPHSDLAGAREYFKHLDQNEQLLIAAIDDKGIESGSIRACKNVEGSTRTRRKLTDEYQYALQNDYNRYRNACKASDVVPVPVSNFVAQRVSFTSGVYEGFLDE